MAPPRRQQELAGRHGYVDGIRYEMPVDSSEAAAIIAAFPCHYEAAAALIPEGSYVQPLRLWSRALLVVTVIDYRQTDIGSYIEYSIALACTRGGRRPAPLLPGLFQRAYGTGQFVVDLPVSTEVSVKGGKGIWGMPKHQANLDFVEGSKWISAQYDVDGAMVSRFDVRRPNRFPIPVNMGAANYCQFRGMIMRSFIHFRGMAGARLLQPGSARFILGDHPRCLPLRALQHRPDPLFAAYLPSVRGLLDDYFDNWFIAAREVPEHPLGEGLETTYPLGYGRTRLPPPARDPGFDPDKE